MSSKKPWPLRLSAREGIATATTSRWTAMLIVVAVAWTTALGAFDAVNVSQLVDKEAEWLAAGGDVTMVYPAMSGESNQESGANLLPPWVCDRVGSYEGIDGAFGIADSITGRVSLAQVPGWSTSLYTVTPGVYKFFDLPTPDESVLLASPAFVRDTGVRNGELVHLVVARENTEVLEQFPPMVLQEVDLTRAGPQFDGAVMVVATHDGDHTCAVRAMPSQQGGLVTLLNDLYSALGAIPKITARLPSSEFATDFSVAFKERPLQWLWLGAVALISLLWAMVQWFRRSQVAIYATFGMGAASRLIMQFSEWAVLALAGLLWGWSLGVVGALALGAHPSHALSYVTQHAVLAFLGTGIFVVIFGLRPTGTLLHTLKDR